MNSTSGPTGLANEAGRINLSDAMWLMKRAKPGIAAILAQVADLLQSGNPLTGFGVPMAQQGVRQARGAAAQSQQGADAFLSREGMTGSPFAAAINAMIQNQGNENVANTATNVGNQFLSMFGQAPFTASSQAMNAMGGIEGMTQSSSSNLGQLFGMGLGGIGGLASGLGNMGFMPFGMGGAGGMGAFADSLSFGGPLAGMAL